MATGRCLARCSPPPASRSAGVGSRGQAVRCARGAKPCAARVVPSRALRAWCQAGGAEPRPPLADVAPGRRATVSHATTRSPHGPASTATRHSAGIRPSRTPAPSTPLFGAHTPAATGGALRDAASGARARLRLLPPMHDRGSAVALRSIDTTIAISRSRFQHERRGGRKADDARAKAAARRGIPPPAASCAADSTTVELAPSTGNLGDQCPSASTV
jgi:hypothetical protein